MKFKNTILILTMFVLGVICGVTYVNVVNYYHIGNRSVKVFIHNVGNQPIERVSIEDAPELIDKMERGQVREVNVYPTREKGIVITYSCNGRVVNVSTSYVGPGYYAIVHVTVDEQGIVSSVSSVMP